MVLYLLQLYVHKHRVDEDLVRSVAIPAADPAAEEVVFLLLRAALNSVPLNALLDSVAAHSTPLLLLWGAKVRWLCLCLAFFCCGAPNGLARKDWVWCMVDEWYKRTLYKAKCPQVALS